MLLHILQSQDSRHSKELLVPGGKSHARDENTEEGEIVGKIYTKKHKLKTHNLKKTTTNHQTMTCTQIYKDTNF